MQKTELEKDMVTLIKEIAIDDSINAILKPETRIKLKRILSQIQKTENGSQKN